MLTMKTTSILLAFVGLSLVGCSTPQDSGFADASTTTPVMEGDAGFGNPDPKTVVGHLRGKVNAPNGMVPIAGALVYLTESKPTPTPEKVYCDECVKLANGTPFAVSNEKGEYDLSITKLGKRFIVIQKGGFRRVREINVVAGDTMGDDALTTLPPKTDLTAGDEVPRMTVVTGQYDNIADSLVKLGVDRSAIDEVSSALIGKAAKEFLSDSAKVNARHIVFLPCGDYTQPTPNTDLSTDPALQDNLRKFVEAGGRLYATDWHYDFINRTFPGYIKFQGASSEACSGCARTPYDVDAVVDDPGLKGWLGAQSLGAFQLVRSYTGIDSVAAQMVTVGGQTKTVTPHVWMSGSKAGAAKKPATVSFEYGCGRVLFSTYHTEPSSLMLTPQERALLGVLLDVNVCNGSTTGVVIK
jgi:hypothetical protein